jgi:hypothetical protein
MAPVLRLQGSGLTEQNPHEYLGKFGGHAEVTTGGISQQDVDIEYDVDIPVQSGGTIDIDCKSLDEAITAGTVIVNVTYDDSAPTKVNSMAQFVDAPTTTTADQYATLGTVTIPKADEGKDPTKIIGLVIAVAPDQGTSAVSLQTTPIVRLSGAGLKGSGTHEYVGKCGFVGEIGTTPSQGIVVDGSTIMIAVDIDINAGGQIDVEQQFADDTPTAGTIAVGFVYE